MAELNFIQEIRERLIRMEATLENNLKISDLKTKDLDIRITKLESTYTWLSRTVIGAILLGVLSAVITYK